MPDYRFCLERGDIRSRAIAFDLPAEWAVGVVAKQVARDLAAREIGSGSLHMAQDVTVRDAHDAVIARYPLADFLTVD